MTTPTTTLAGLTRAIGEITGLSQVLAAWRGMVTVSIEDNAHVQALTRQLIADLHKCESQRVRLLATQQVLQALENACYFQELEPGALAIVHTAMEANNVAMAANTRAQEALAAAVAAQRAAGRAQSAALAALQDAQAYVRRVHVPVAEAETATGARSSRDFHTT